jgi:hypothetical protein
MQTRGLFIAALAAALMLAACGDDDTPPAETATKTGTTVRTTNADTSPETTGLRGGGLDSELTTASDATPGTS